MSARSAPDVETPIERCRPAAVTPVRVEAESLESTASEYLRELKEGFTSEGLSPTELVVDADFAPECSLETQREADRIRELIRAGAFLGVDRVLVDCEPVADSQRVRSAVEACIERADREGIALDVGDALE